MKPKSLAQVIEALHYKDGWEFRVGDTPFIRYLYINVRTINSETGQPTTITHVNALPPVSHGEYYDWELFLLHKIIDVEIHEAMEFFVVDGVAPFWPDHKNPYSVQRAAQPHVVQRPNPEELRMCPYCLQPKNSPLLIKPYWE